MSSERSRSPRSSIYPPPSLFDPEIARFPEADLFPISIVPSDLDFRHHPPAHFPLCLFPNTHTLYIYISDCADRPLYSTTKRTERRSTTVAAAIPRVSAGSLTQISRDGTRPSLRRTGTLATRLGQRPVLIPFQLVQPGEAPIRVSLGPAGTRPLTRRLDLGPALG